MVSNSPERTKNNDINHFTIPRIKIGHDQRNIDSSRNISYRINFTKRHSDSIQSIDKKKYSLPITSNGGDNVELRAWSPAAREEDLLTNMNKVYFEQPD